ncbi:MAG TPA: hypothetical protein VLG37_02545 [Candidatus Saccharimonadales bacterium]|nr:hypothetical protein [Candidatus Saccharimonadales bacterium]
MTELSGEDRGKPDDTSEEEARSLVRRVFGATEVPPAREGFMDDVMERVRNTPQDPPKAEDVGLAPAEDPNP